MKAIEIKGTTILALVDDEDYSKVIGLPWRVQYSRNNRVCGIGYTKKINSKSYPIQLARFILNLDDWSMADHIDRNPFNNQKNNLRLCSYQQNSMNKAKASTRKFSSKYKGVSWVKCKGKWQASTKFNGRTISLGHHFKEEDAALAYNKFVKEKHGDFAYLNIIETANQIETMMGGQAQQ